MGRFFFTLTIAALGVFAALPVQAQAPASLLARRGGLPCQIVMGRIVLAGERGIAAQSDAIEDEADARRESLCIQAGEGQTIVRYERIAGDERLAIDLLGYGDLRIQYTPSSGSHTSRAAVLFVQPLSGPVRLEIAESVKDRRVHSAESLWHLLLIQPDACGQHLLPLLDELRPNWQLAARATAIERALAVAAKSPTPVDAKHVARLIDRLGGDSFATRQAAYHELEGLGLAVLPPLSKVDVRRLDAEQRERILALQTAFQPTTPDTPERVAAWLVGDDSIRQTLASRHSETARDGR